MPQDVYDYKYLGKPDHTQRLDKSYSLVDLSKFMPANKGAEFSLEYINVTPTFESGETVGGAIRMRLKRDDDDNSWYDDLPVLKCMLDDDGKALFTRVYFESGQLGMGTKIQMRCQGGLKSAVLSTRYRKVLTLKDKG
jgi:hypothetical protein